MASDHTYQNLLVWQKSMTLVTEIYNAIKGFPSDEIYGLTSQIKRSAISVPSNIAEGYGRDGKKDYLRFLNIALQTQIEIAINLKFLDEGKFNELYHNTREIERMLTSFIRKIKD